MPLLAQAAALLMVASSSAVTLDVPRLPAPAFADCEASDDTAISESAFRDLRRFGLELAFSATSSNNVQVAFGRDAEPLDGHLAAEETALIIGWDSGEWFLRPAGLRARHTFNPADAQTPRRRTLKATIRVSAAGTPTSVTFGDDAGTFTFEELALTPPPAWLVPEDWNLLRVTVRGADEATENVEARFLPDGAIIILR
jgi:hypothetical protein